MPTSAVIGTAFRTGTEEERLALIEACSRAVLPLLREGRLKSPVDRIFPLEVIAQADAYMASDQHFGKIVLAVHADAMAAGAQPMSRHATKEMV